MGPAPDPPTPVPPTPVISVLRFTLTHQRGEGSALPGSPLLPTLSSYLRQPPCSPFVLVTTWKGSPDSVLESPTQSLNLRPPRDFI